MSSAAKTLELLSHFSVAQPELGLSKICRLAKHDKATTYRYLQALEGMGFVEQNPTTKQYRLGPALLQLAQIRELTVPREAGCKAALDVLSDTTGETAHVSVLSGTNLYPLTSSECPRHGIRAVIDVAKFPLHATASGLCTLSFGPASLTDFAKTDLQRYSPRTITTGDALDAEIEFVRSNGFGRSNGGLDEGVYSLAAPLFDQTGQLAGAVAVATVSTRFTPKLEQIIRAALIEASREITHNWGGTVPPDIEANWANSLSSKYELETDT